ncbi:MAG: threonine--tRNA ligase, partial [Bacteroidales bacterium]|nr:threonine--tRNA ligase [Bacteroidales bacterium]
EHTGGNFPLWLTPDQVIILPISDKYMDYAQSLMQTLDKNDIRVSIDDRSEKTGRKIRDAELRKIPYMLIIGEKEESEHTVSVRQHGMKDLGTMSIPSFIEHINNEVTNSLA